MVDIMDAYLWATVERIRLNRTLFPTAKIAAASCLIMPDDKAPPNCGRIFVGVRGGNVSNPDPAAGRLYEKGDIVITVTNRTDNVPTDRRGQARYAQKPDVANTDIPLTINRIRLEVLRQVHQSNDLVGLVQNYLNTQEPGDIQWPALSVLNWMQGSSSGPQVVGPEHFESGLEEGQVEGRNESGLVFRLTFSGVERLQAWP